MARTHMERMGFQDPEIGTPEHDKLALWIEEHAPEWIAKHIETPNDGWAAARKKIFAEQRAKIAEEERRKTELEQSLGRDPLYESEEQIKAYRDRLRKELAEVEARIRASEKAFRARAPGERVPDSKPEFKLQMEYLLATERGYALGYIDLKATVAYPRYRVIEPCGPCYAQDREPSRIENIGVNRYAAFEAKIQIPSLGELLRQLRFYQERWSRYSTRQSYSIHDEWLDVPYAVVSRDAQFRSAIERQGFHFWNPDEPSR